MQILRYTESIVGIFCVWESGISNEKSYRRQVWACLFSSRCPTRFVVARAASKIQGFIPATNILWIVHRFVYDVEDVVHDRPGSRSGMPKASEPAIFWSFIGRDLSSSQCYVRRATRHDLYLSVFACVGIDETPSPNLCSSGESLVLENWKVIENHGASRFWDFLWSLGIPATVRGKWNRSVHLRGRFEICFRRRNEYETRLSLGDIFSRRDAEGKELLRDNSRQFLRDDISNIAWSARLKKRHLREATFSNWTLKRECSNSARSS